MKFDIKLLIATLIAGVITAVAGIFLYDMLIGILPGILLITILIALVAVVITVTILIVVSANLNTDNSFLFLNGKGFIILGTVVCLVVLFAITGGLEFLYELDTDLEILPVESATSYIFILDESGSMDANDPNYQRDSAVRSLMQSKPDDFPYAVYVFANQCQQIRDMAPASEAMPDRPFYDSFTLGALTYIGEALDYVYNDIESGVIDGGEHPQVILLTDGIANDMDAYTNTAILKSYAAKKITISTIGLGNSIDHALMEYIANTTGGTYVHVLDADQLEQGFASSVSVTAAQRNLLSARNNDKNSLVYGILRVLFLTVIGVAFAFIKAMASAKSDNTGIILLVGAISAFIGALTMELGTLFGLPPVIFRSVYLLCLAITPGYESVQTGNLGTGYIYGYQDVFSGKR